MALVRDAVGDHAGNGNVAVVRETVRNCAEGLCHRARIDDRRHRNVEAAGETGARRAVVVESHHALHDQHVGLSGRLVQKRAALALADHPQVELMHRRPGRAFEDHGVEEVRPGFEDAHLQATPTVQARKTRHHGGLSLPGSRRGDPPRRAASRHNVAPGWARTPACLERLLTSVMSGG